MSDEEKQDLFDPETMGRYIKPLDKKTRYKFMRLAGAVYENTGNKHAALKYAQTKVRRGK